jgi:galactokinase/mevalonate kinase-like predicted kinase
MPAAAVAALRGSEHLADRRLFVASDPPGSQLGSGGGTVHLLVEAWRSGRRAAFDEWLRDSRKLLVHGSGESRRLPAYAVVGKPLVPMPVFRHLPGQRLDQTLLDLQLQVYEQLYRHASPSYRVLVSCGDVLLRCPHWLPAYPEADVLIFGLTASPEEASHHGVMISSPGAPTRLDFFLQKPSVGKLQQIGASRRFYLDTGVWLLSERAVQVLMRKCGWNPRRQAFGGGRPGYYDLFAAFGPALGVTPALRDAEVNALTAAVLPLPDARFYHFGTSRSLLASVSQMQSPAADQRTFGHASLDGYAEPVLLHADVHCALGSENRHIWIENASIPADWTLSRHHVLTNIPPNEWALRLAPGVCLDAVPLARGTVCLRPYGFDDAFRGPVGAAQTLWIGTALRAWLQRRGLTLAEAGLDPATDIHAAPILPVVAPRRADGPFVNWLLDPNPVPHPEVRARWQSARRLAARDLLRHGQARLILDRRAERSRRAWARLDAADWMGLCTHVDLAALARRQAGAADPAPVVRTRDLQAAGLGAMHDRMYRAALERVRRNRAGQARREKEAFDSLRRLVVNEIEVAPVVPCRNVQDDQIVWGRAPVRLDLAGGWTDTPPYCIEHGGHVVNVAVNLNSQPPIQVFARIASRPVIVLRSIDLGIDQTVRTYEELQRYAHLGSGFAIARAALALAGLEPRFHSGRRYGSLARQLESEFGGGIELSMVCAIPKGSGLGTSSILAATLLGTLSELCRLGWTPADLFARTMALEQMLTSGGGWQDQVGGIVGGVKLVETQPGLAQDMVVRRLPDTFFADPAFRARALLYYTGLTRVAHDILGEIVRGLFLNAAEHLCLIDEIGHNALFAADAIQRHDWPGLCEAVQRSWRLNQLLDRGTNPPAVQAILGRIAPWMSACKLLGAGGGGYILILARDEDAARRIRATLTDSPPNRRARFVELSLSPEGLRVTRS